MVLTFKLSQIRAIIDCSANVMSPASENLQIKNVCTDSRSVEAGDLFVALRGENFDGHDFVTTALAKGAIAAVVERPLDLPAPWQGSQLLVKNTLLAYQNLARAWRQHLNTPIIGITGSVGKTTTKEMIVALLASFGRVHKTEANYNNEIGVPKTLLVLTPDHDYGVVEMAMRGRGEIALLSQISQPNIGLITNVGTAHIGRLGSEQAIAEAKCELLAEMPSDSVAILNYDSPRLLATARQVWSGTTLTYGLTGGDWRGELQCDQTLKIGELTFPLPLPGRHQASNYLGALACAQVLGLDWQRFTQGLQVELPGGRARRLLLSSDICLLDETYNAGLESMLAALQLLVDTEGQRHIAVLGAMRELGEQAEEFHQQVGQRVQELDIDYLFLLTNDPAANAIAQGARGVACQSFREPEDLVASLAAFVQNGDRLLFKASNSIGLGRVVEALSNAKGFQDS